MIIYFVNIYDLQNPTYMNAMIPTPENGPEGIPIIYISRKSIVRHSIEHYNGYYIGLKPYAKPVYCRVQ
jgi:hypothetical protein